MRILVKDIARPFTCIDKDVLIPQAWEVLETKKESHLVVTDEGRVVGIVSIKDFLFPLMDKARRRKFARFYISSIMTTTLVSISGNRPLHEAIEKMLSHGISSILVYTDDPKAPKYILTKKDIVKNINKFPSVSVKQVGTLGNIIVGHPGTKITTAESLLRERKISTLPIVERNRLIGYIDVRILASFLVSSYLEHPEHFHTILRTATLDDIMKSPIIAEPDDKLHRIAPELIRRNFKGAVITREITPLGVLTETDVARYVYSIFTTKE